AADPQSNSLSFLKALCLGRKQRIEPARWRIPFQSWRPEFDPKIHTVLPQHVHPVTQSPQKQQETVPPEVFWCVSLSGVLTNAAQLRNVRQTNTCVLLAKNLSLCVLSHACFSRTSSLLCLPWPFTPVSTLMKCFPSRVHPSKTPSNQLSKEPLSFHCS
ncbi:mCG61979, isoform CRA_b, partial [Mus musculus]